MTTASSNAGVRPRTGGSLAFFRDQKTARKLEARFQTTTIASAVEEQTGDHDRDARNVAEAAQETTSGANNISQAAGELFRMPGELHELVGRFRY